MSLINEFKTFALRGNIVDLALAVIVGTAFGKVISSLVNDIFMPPLGLLIGGVDFSDLGIPLKNAVDNQPAVVVKYGVFLNTILEFLIISFALFVVIKLFNKLKSVEPAKPASTKDCAFCLMPIPVLAKRCGHCCSDVK